MISKIINAAKYNEVVRFIKSNELAEKDFLAYLDVVRNSKQPMTIKVEKQLAEEKYFKDKDTIEVLLVMYFGVFERGNKNEAYAYRFQHHIVYKNDQIVHQYSKCVNKSSSTGDSIGLKELAEILDVVAKPAESDTIIVEKEIARNYCDEFLFVNYRKKASSADAFFMLFDSVEFYKKGDVVRVIAAEKKPEDRYKAKSVQILHIGPKLRSKLSEFELDLVVSKAETFVKMAKIYRHYLEIERLSLSL